MAPVPISGTTQRLHFPARELGRWCVAGVAAVLGLALIGAIGATLLASHDAARAAALAGAPSQARVWWMRALRLRPDMADYHRGLAAALQDSNPAAARTQAAQAAQLNPGDWQNWSALSLLNFQLGDAFGALRDLQQGARVNTGYVSHLELAELNQLYGNVPTVWRQLHAAWQMVPPQDTPNLVAATLRAPGFTPKRLQQLVPLDARVRANSIGPLVAQGRDDLAASIWAQVQCGTGDFEVCRGAAMTLVLALTEASFRAPANSGGQLFRQALAAWRAGTSAGYLLPPAAAWGRSADPRLLQPALENFSLPWVGPRWSWSNNADAQLLPNPAGGVLVQLSGYEADAVQLGVQFVGVNPGERYRLRLLAQAPTDNADAIVAAVRAGQQDPDVAAIAAHPDGSLATTIFEAPTGTDCLELDLRYVRPVGSPPVNGAIWIREVSLEPAG